jgi:hypothetical protein
VHCISQPDRSLLALPDTGPVRVVAGGWHLAADVGAPCPDDLPAHSHGGALGCVLHVNGVPLIVDTGAPGPVPSCEWSATARRPSHRAVHRRSWLMNGAGVRVDDELTGRGLHAVAVRWHLAAATRVRLTAGGAVVSTAAGQFPVQIRASAPLRISIDSAMVATGFQTSILTPVLTCRVDSALPIRITTCWRRSLGDLSRTP